MPKGNRQICSFCATFFHQAGDESICDLCTDEGIIEGSESLTMTSNGFPCNPINSRFTVASVTALDHAPRGSSRDDYFEFRRELARKYDGVRKGYADMSDFEDIGYDPNDPNSDNQDKVIYEVLNRCVQLRKNNR